MPLFQRTIIKKHLLELNNKEIDSAYGRFTAYFHNPTIQSNIRNSKEEQFQEGFLRELFGHVLNYTLNPNPGFNLTTELKNTTNSKKVDGAIVINDKAIAVIELKGTDTTDLSKIETQAFGYKNNQSECTYVITSNFEKLRFYIDNTIDYEEFNLFTLTRDQFNLLYLCLSFENIKDNVPKRLKMESVSQEDQITKKLYKDYSDFKRALFSNLVELNPGYDKLLLFKKTQKLLDRFLFILFAEDRLLLPTNLIFRINQEWKNLVAARVPVSLYDRYKMYFDDLNHGAKVTLPAFGKKTGDAITAEFEIFAYNGGLFQPDEILDNVKIDDALLHTYSEKLSHYDFDSDVDVNILGHIFENSLNEIDEIKAELEGHAVEKTKTKRKKDGVFYTPKYITKYIVDNTVGQLCEEKKAELDIKDEYYINDKKQQARTKKALLDKLSEYRKWLLDLTICDPACGSGAFLNQALEFLISEHRYVDELQAKMMGDAMILSDVETSILENNIYGVDLNDESVEIAKLSLWLRTAQKGRKLNSLNNNIKCGNSLIDDPEVAGDKAFSWENEFPEVFAKGGFDVVIGNPPYGDYFKDAEKQYLITEYAKTFSGTFDMYIMFFEVALNSLKKNGILGYITPNTFIDYSQFSALREILMRDNDIQQVIGLNKVFDDAIVDTAITIMCKGTEQCDKFYGEVFKQKISHIDFSILSELDKTNLHSTGFVLKNTGAFNIYQLLEKFPKKLSEIVRITQGITTGGNECFIAPKVHFLRGQIDISAIHKVVKGKTINRYKIVSDEEYILYSTKVLDQKTQNSIAQLLEPYREKLSKKRETIQGKLPWYCLHWARNEEDFNEPKILIRQTADSIIGVLDKENHYPIDSIHTLNLIEKTEIKENKLLSLLGILNSKLFKFLYQWKLDESGTVYPQVKKVNIEWLPIPENIEIEPLYSVVNKIQGKQVELENLSSKFLKYIGHSLSIEDKQLMPEQWYEQGFTMFIQALAKAIQKSGGTALSKVDEMEWMDLFETKKKEAFALKTDIEKLDNEIDRMVYELYGLNEEEIKIVEGV